MERRELVEYGSQTRSIRLTLEVVDLLIMERSKHPSSLLMFMHPATLKSYSPQMVRRMHNEIIKEAGLDRIRFTDLRHTCAVLSLRNGMETKELARMWDIPAIDNPAEPMNLICRTRCKRMKIYQTKPTQASFSRRQMFWILF